MKKSAAEAHRLLVEAYSAALSERSCREWFQKFKNGEFDVEDKERSGRPKVYEDVELEALLDEDSCQTQKELALTLGATQQTISYHLKSLRMIQKQGNSVLLYELKPRNIERRFFTCEMLLARHKRKGFLHRIVTDEKWIHYWITQRRRNHWDFLVMLQHRQPNIHGKKLMLCIWWDQLGVVYYELLKPNKTITGALYRTQLMRLSRTFKEKRAHYHSRHDKIILLHDNARSHVAAPIKTYLETLKWEVLSHPPYSPDIALSDYHLFRSMTHGLSEQHFTSYEDIKNR